MSHSFDSCSQFTNVFTCRSIPPTFCLPIIASTNKRCTLNIRSIVHAAPLLEIEITHCTQPWKPYRHNTKGHVCIICPSELQSAFILAKLGLRKQKT